MDKASQYRTTEQETEQKAIGLQGAEDRSLVSAKGEDERKTMKDASSYRTVEQEKEQESIGKQGAEDRLNIKAKGEDDRSSMEKQDTLAARKEARASGRQKALARSF